MINKNMQTVLNSMPECILILDINKRIIWANKNTEKLTNLSTQDIIGKKCYEAVMCTNKECHDCPFSETLQKKCCEEREISPLKGRRLYVRTTPFIDSNGFDAIMEIIKDCIEEERIKKEILNKLISNSNQFQSMMQNSSDIVCLLDKEGIIKYCSPSINRITEYKESEVLERPITDFFHKEDIQIIKKSLKKLIKSPGDHIRLYSNIVQKREDMVYTEIIATNMLQEPSVQRIVLNIRDISGRRRAEIEQDKLISALKEKNFKLEVFASNLYHNLQSPLSTIGGYTSMLQEALEKENTKDIELCAEIIMKAALQISQHAKSIGHCIREELKD